MGKKITLIFLFFLLFQINTRELRNLFEEEEIQIICSYCQSDFNETYKDILLINSTKDDDKIKEYVINFIEILKNDSKNSSDLINEYVIPRFLHPNIIYIIFVITSIFIWIILITLICLDSKKNIFSKCFMNNKSSNILSYLTIIISLALIVLSSFSLSYIKKEKNYFNSSICSLLRVYIDIKKGDQANTTNWVGINKLQEDLVGDQSVINQLITKINSQENLTLELKNNKYEKNTFDEEEKNNKYFSDITVNSPNSLENKVFPSYSKKRKDTLNKILLEYNLKLKHGIEINEDISLLNKPIKENPELISKEYLIINNKLNDILITVQDSAEEYLQYIIDYTKYINNILFPILYAIFILLILSSISIIIFIIIHMNKNCQTQSIKISHKIALNIFWNFLSSLLIFIIASQIAFKILEIFSIDGSGLIQYATSEQNFNSSDSIIFKGAGKVFLKVCFRSDTGDLLSTIISYIPYNSSKIKELDRIYLAEIVFTKYYDIIKKIEFNETENIISDLENMYKDYSLISYYEDSLLTIEKKCQYDLDELSKYTDYSNPITSYQSTLLNNNHSYDIWTSVNINCNKYDKYKYINRTIDRIYGNKYCLVIDEFDGEKAKCFYTNIKTTKSLLKNVDEIFYEYHQALKQFEEDNKKLLKNNPTNFILRTQLYHDDLVTIKNNILKGIEYSKDIVSLLNKLLGNPYFGLDLFSIMNCWFLKRDAKVFYIEMDKLKINSGPFLIFNIAIIILVFIEIIFLAIINCKYKYKNDGDIDKFIGMINNDSMSTGK